MRSGKGDLYIVYVSGPSTGLDDHPDITALSEVLYVVRTDQTRSQLYHSIKRRTAPRQLLVAPLAGPSQVQGNECRQLTESTNYLGLIAAYGSV